QFRIAGLDRDVRRPRPDRQRAAVAAGGVEHQPAPRHGLPTRLDPDAARPRRINRVPDRQQRELRGALYDRSAVPAHPGVRTVSARTLRLLFAAGLATVSTGLATLAIAAPVAGCHTGGVTPAADGWTQIRPPAFV